MSTAETNLTVPENLPPEPIQKSGREKTADMVYRLFRCIMLFNVVAIFFPPFNPARVSGLINQNLSIFTCGVSYGSLIDGVGRAFRMEWVDEAYFRMINIYSIVVIISAVLIGVAGCMSLGNNKLKKMGLIFSFVGGAAQILAMFQFQNIFVVFNNLESANRVLPMHPQAIFMFYILAGAVVFFSVINFLLVPKSDKDEKVYIEPKFQLFLMMLPVIALAFVFAYLPLYGWRYAFFDYRAGETLTMDSFAGGRYFTELFQNAATRSDIVRVLRNTFAMSGLGLLTSWVPLAFAVFLSEIKNTRYRRVVQTFTTVPNFISWVLVYAIALAIFSTDGFVNTLINSMGGSATENYLGAQGSVFSWFQMLAWGMWKGLGWSAIIYLAAISGIDQSLYEAATIDGAGRFAKMWYITVPSLIPTFFVLLLLQIAGILSNGLEQYLVFSNSFNVSHLEVLDLYVYNIGLGQSGLIPLSTVVGMLRTLVSVALLFAANRVSKIVRGESIV